MNELVFYKLQLVIFIEDIRSEGLLMGHAADRLSRKWYLGYDLNEPLPDHSSLTKKGAAHVACSLLYDPLVRLC